MLPALVLATAYLVVQPSSADLAAQTFRANLFSAHGFVLWSNDWYSGHLVPGYSFLYPPLAALVGPRMVGAIAAVVSAALFGALARHRFGERAWIGSFWFGAATATMLFSGRLTFCLGVAVALGSLLALQRGRTALAVALAVMTTLASPVAGLFLALFGVAVMVAVDRRRGAAVALGALGALAAVSYAFPLSGDEPYVFSAFYPVLIMAGLAFFLLPREESTLRWAVALYALLATALFLVPNPVGGNASRLGQLAVGPMLAVVLVSRRRPWVLALAAAPLLFWQIGPPVRDVAAAAGDPSVHASYYAPLLHELHQLAPKPARVEIPPTQDRWEATYVAPHFPLARGWMRQLESGDAKLFTGNHLNRDRYRTWLHREGVSFVALPDARLDYLAKNEAKLIKRDPRYLDEVWSNKHWRVYAVVGATGLADGGARVAKLEPDAFTVAAPERGRYLVRIHFTHYWTVTKGHACIARHGQWSQVQMKRPGRVSVEANFSVSGLLGRDRECSG